MVAIDIDDVIGPAGDGEAAELEGWVLSETETIDVAGNGARPGGSADCADAGDGAGATR